MTILEKLKIFGYSSAQENAIFACLLLGEPGLFIGPPGTAKTEVVNAIGSALRELSKRNFPQDPSKWFSYQIYDASKLNFEDLIGYPSPEAIKANPPRVVYIPTASTIWNKNLIAFDELNRCQEDRQSNLFEIIRSRKLHGIPTYNQFIFSTMNPFGDEGTVSMSDALVDRHLFYLRIGRFADMASDAQRKVINRVGSVDAVGMRYWGQTKEEFDVYERFENGKPIINNTLADIGQEIVDLMSNSAKFFADLKESLSYQLTEIITKVIRDLDQEFAKEQMSVRKEIDISGRRASSILRGILALRSIEHSNRKEKDTIPDVTGTIINGIKLAVPIGISGKLDEQLITRADAIIEKTVRANWPLIKKNKDTIDVDKVSEALSSSNPIKIIDTLLTVDMNTITREKIYNGLLNPAHFKKKLTFCYVKHVLQKLNKDIPDFAPASVKIAITQEEANEISKDDTLPLPVVFHPYIDILHNLSKKASENGYVLPVLIRAAYNYYADTITTEEQLIKSIVEIKSLMTAITTKMEYIKNINKNTDENNKEESQSTSDTEQSG